MVRIMVMTSSRLLSCYPPPSFTLMIRHCSLFHLFSLHGSSPPPFCSSFCTFSDRKSKLLGLIIPTISDQPNSPHRIARTYHTRHKPSGSSGKPHGIEPSSCEYPASEKPQFYNRFDYADHSDLFLQESRLFYPPPPSSPIHDSPDTTHPTHFSPPAAGGGGGGASPVASSPVPQHPPVSSPGELVESTTHPHQREGMGVMERFTSYNTSWEPVIQKHPDFYQGELVSGSNFYRTNAWNTKQAKMNQDEPAVVSVSRFNPQSIRPIGYAENAPMPDSMNPEGIPDFREYRLPSSSPDRRTYTYLITATAAIAAASMARSFICAAVSVYWIPKGLVAAGKVEVDLKKIDVGREIAVDYRGKPCFVKRRTGDQIQRARDDDKLLDSLRHPELDEERVQRPEWLVVSGVCTHLGCVPHEGGSYGGYFCPCHGSHYDTSGRIRSGPAPTNLVVPPYKFLDNDTILIGD